MSPIRLGLFINIAIIIRLFKVGIQGISNIKLETIAYYDRIKSTKHFKFGKLVSKICEILISEKYKESITVGII